MSKLFLAMLALLMAVKVEAASNVNSDQAFAWGANLGWLNWQPTAIDGAQIGEFVCSGFIYAANVGWIHLGNGQPANGIYYRNDSAIDFGVNHDPLGHLSGLAYSANIGWINFETNGAPRIDPQTGKFNGFVYGANVGWISLGDAAFSVRVDSIRRGTDSDNDGIPDAWELMHAGNLTAFNAESDTDNDGFSDLQEYLADTDPKNPEDHLRILDFSLMPSEKAVRLTWATRPTRQYFLQVRSQFSTGTDWTDSGLGRQFADGAQISRTITNLVSSGQSYFRIQAVSPAAP